MKLISFTHSLSFSEAEDTRKHKYISGRDESPRKDSKKPEEWKNMRERERGCGHGGSERIEFRIEVFA